MRLNMRYKGKWALITGVGLGNMAEGIAMGFHNVGIKTLLVGHDQKKVEQVATKLRGGRERVIQKSVDFEVMVSHGPKSYKEFVDELRKAVPEIHILVHAAGYAREAAFMDTDIETFERTFAVNLSAPFFLTQEILRSKWMSEGAIINIASTVGESTHGWSGGMAYSLSKAAMLLWSQMMAVELAPKIRVNTILPGSIDTPMADELLGESGKKQMAASIPLKRLGSVDEVASVVLELVNNPYLSGTEVRVDGARTVGG
jgi:NAD(P)-dependent dehydrogenase (short-subunit alcohol dehydrogenase family)